MRYFPPYETAGLATLFVSSWSLLPRPPAKIIANMLFCFIVNPHFPFICLYFFIIHFLAEKFYWFMLKNARKMLKFC